MPLPLSRTPSLLACGAGCYVSLRRIGNPPLEFVHFLEKVGHTIVFRGLLVWALGPRNFMKNSAGQGIPGCSSWFFDPVMPRQTRAGLGMNALLDGEAVRGSTNSMRA